MKIRILLVALLIGAAGSSPLFAWNYEGHRMVNQLALASLPEEFPAFVHQPENAERITFLAGEADRWRNIRTYRSSTTMGSIIISTPSNWLRRDWMRTQYQICAIRLS